VLSVLLGRDVVLWPDADEPGRAHMARIAERLQGVARSVRTFQWPHAPEHGDAADFTEQGGTAHDVRAMLAYATGEPESPAPERAQNVRLTRLAMVKPEPVRWLWPGRIPLGMVTVLDGDPGLGKSTMLLDLAARLTRGDRMPDGSPGPKPS